MTENRELVVGMTYEIDGALMRYIGNDTFVSVIPAGDLAKRFDAGGPLLGQPFEVVNDAT